jgi:hypothetical protein
MNTELIEVKKQFEADVVDNTLIAQANDLAIEHENFHANYIVAGRIALYELLGKIYALALKLDGAIDKTDQISIMRTVLAEKYGIRTQENTPDLTILVRYITRADRKTAHVYARAIESAKESGVQPMNMVGFIEHHGGIERIRISGADYEGSADIEQEKIRLAKTYLAIKADSPFTSFDGPKEFEGIYSNSCAYEIVICSLGVGNKYHVIGKLPADPALEDLAIRHFSKHLCKNMDLARNEIAKMDQKNRELKRERASVSCEVKS